MRAVFDLDDTICKHNKRDYINAEPIAATVTKIQQLKQDGWEIVIYSSRGQVSCKGDLELIEQKNRATAEAWLQKNGVPYDALIFGKPIADLYVDDKGISLEAFLSEPFGALAGGSGSRVYRMGSVVKKEFKDRQECETYQEWVSQNADTLAIPRIRSWLYSAVYMDYVEGQRLCDCEDIDFDKFIEIWETCRQKDKCVADISAQLQILELNRTGTKDVDNILDAVKCYLRENEQWFASQGSFSHGDMTLCNIIRRPDGELYFLDARHIAGASSYLLDIAKFKMSVSGYEKIFGISETDHASTRAQLDDYLRQRHIEKEIGALCLMYILRLYRYKPVSQKELVKEFAKREYAKWIK